MLLYDRVVESFSRAAEQLDTGFATFFLSPRHKERLKRVQKALRSAMVYQISDVVPLFSDWETEKDKPIPRRPPGPLTWCEWDFHEVFFNGHIDWTIGTLITALPKWPLSTPAPEIAAGYTEWYLVQIFRQVNGGTFRPFPLRQPTIEARPVFVGMKDDSQRLELFLFDEPQPHRLITPERQLFSYFNLDVVSSAKMDGGTTNQTFCPWPPFMAFALLHCKNVIQEQVVPDERLQRCVQESGNSRRCTYKVLRIEVPQTQKGYRPLNLTNGEAAPKRFHLCRGHFKNLQHERFQNKGWHWWPAHWRGSRALGEVRKSYALVPASAK
jgi:hypothetical protein